MSVSVSAASATGAPARPSEERLISADSHVAVPAAAIRARLASEVQERFDAALATQAAEQDRLTGGVKLQLDSWDLPGARDPGYFDPTARLAAMDRDGVDAEVLYSELSAFRSYGLLGDAWKQVARAFNDVLADFASVDPQRLVVSYQVPLLDVEHAVAEVERLAAAGARSIQLPSHPHDVGLAPYHDPVYDPLWRTFEETGLTISQHLGPKSTSYDVYRHDPTPQKGIFTSQQAFGLAETIGFWILPGVFERFPRLKVVLVEPSLEWVPFYLSMLDRMSTTYYDFPALTMAPSDYFRRNMHLTFVDDERGLALRHEIGVDNIMWSTDFPHPASSWPTSRQVVERNFAGIPADERRRIVCDNAARVYGL